MVEVKPSVCIQHHPKRAHLIAPLLGRVGGPCEVITDPLPDDPVPSPLRTYLQCLRTIPADATHRVILQDDTWPIAGFYERMLAAIDERPDDVIALHVQGAPPHRQYVEKAKARGDRWVQLAPAWLPTVATVWPVQRAAEFVTWEETRMGEGRRTRQGDDAPAGRWAARTRVPIWALVPSIVEHPDVEPSLIGRKHGAGRNRLRVAAALADETTEVGLST
jgi:hypothetical protein